MVGFRTKFFLRAFPAVFLIFFSGCASVPRARGLQYSDAPTDTLFLTPTPDFNSSEFFSRWSGEVSERDKIRYLLERIASSKNRFIRNDEIFDGPRAEQWILYKLGHWVRGVDTAEDFVMRVASFSQKTGEPYRVEFPEGKVYSLRSVLKNELSAFEKYRVAFNANSRSVAQGAGPVPLPPVLTAPASK